MPNHDGMYRMQVPAAELRLAAREQGDLITTRQATNTGFGTDALDRMVRDGHWERQANGLYDTAPSHDSFDKRVWSAALRADLPCAIGGESALRLHGLDRPVDRIEVWVGEDRRPRSADDLRIRRDKLGRIERATGSPPRIRIEDALVDVGQHLGVESLVSILADSNRLRFTTFDRVRRCLDQRHRVRRRALFADILGDLEGIESTLEYVYRRDVERAHGLPTALRQESKSAGTRSDALYDEQAVLVELDGRLGHEDARSTFRDLRRDNTHATSKLLTLRYGTVDVRGRPCAVARQLWTVLSERGWNEPFRSCPRCPS